MQLNFGGVGGIEKIRRVVAPRDAGGSGVDAAINAFRESNALGRHRLRTCH
jgi:hypothetical protein